MNNVQAIAIKAFCKMFPIQGKRGGGKIKNFGIGTREAKGGRK